MKAYLKNYRQSPRKVRLVTDIVRGKKVDDALVVLDHMGKRATHQLRKLIMSAVSNTKEDENVNRKDLFIKDARVDDGVILKRYRPVSRGAAHSIRKRTSNITIELGKIEGEKKEETKKDKK